MPKEALMPEFTLRAAKPLKTRTESEAITSELVQMIGNDTIKIKQAWITTSEGRKPVKAVQCDGTACWAVTGTQNDKPVGVVFTQLSVNDMVSVYAAVYAALTKKKQYRR